MLARDVLEMLDARRLVVSGGEARACRGSVRELVRSWSTARESSRDTWQLPTINEMLAAADSTRGRGGLAAIRGALLLGGFMSSVMYEPLVADDYEWINATHEADYEVFLQLDGKPSRCDLEADPGPSCPCG